LSFFARDAVAVRWSAFLQVRDSSWPLHRDRREQASFSFFGGMARAHFDAYTRRGGG